MSIDIDRCNKYITQVYTYIYIYMWSHPPLRQTLELHFQSVQEGGGRPTLQNSSSFQKSKNPKNPTKGFGFLEARAGASKSKNRAKSSSFQNSKNPKIPTQVSDFWKLEREPQNPKIEQIPRLSKIPKIQKTQPKFRILGNSSGSLKIQKSSKFLEFPKFQKSKNPNPSFGFLETRAGASKSKNRANSSSFQNSKPWGDFFGLLEFWKLEEFARFLDLEAPARVSKIPKIQKLQPKFRIFGNSSGGLKIQKSSKLLEFPKFQTLGWFFLDFWNFGNSRNLLDFCILRLSFEFPKIQTFGVDFWIFGILETGVWIRFFQGFVYDSLL